MPWGTKRHGVGNPVPNLWGSARGNEHERGLDLCPGHKSRPDPRPPDPRPPGRRVSLLVVEDEPRVADFLARGLRAEGYPVTVAHAGREGLDLARTHPFDLILLDLMLPDMSGLAVCQELRARGIRTPTSILTALDTTEDKVKGLRLGADDYLTKPFDVDELLARIEALIRRSRGLPPDCSPACGGRSRLRSGVLDRAARRAGDRPHRQGAGTA